jgi:hypothetical protein
MYKHIQDQLVVKQLKFHPLILRQIQRGRKVFQNELFLTQMSESNHKIKSKRNII